MKQDTPIQEGYVSFRGCRVWYRIVGDHEEPGSVWIRSRRAARARG